MKFKKRRNNREFANKKLLSLADLGIMVMMMFVFTITVFNEKGLMAKLTPWSGYHGDYYCFKKRNVLFIRFDENNQLLVNRKPIAVSKLRKEVKDFILNNGKKSDYSTSPKAAIILFQPNMHTRYETYFNAYHEIKAAYNEIWDKEAKKRFSYKFEHLGERQKYEVTLDYPYFFTENEPTDYTYANR